MNNIEDKQRAFIAEAEVSVLGTDGKPLLDYKPYRRLIMVGGTPTTQADDERIVKKNFIDTLMIEVDEFQSLLENTGGSIHLENFKVTPHVPKQEESDQVVSCVTNELAWKAIEFKLYDEHTGMFDKLKLAASNPKDYDIGVVIDRYNTPVLCVVVNNTTKHGKKQIYYYVNHDALEDRYNYARVMDTVIGALKEIGNQLGFDESNAEPADSLVNDTYLNRAFNFKQYPYVNIGMGVIRDVLENRNDGLLMKDYVTQQIEINQKTLEENNRKYPLPPTRTWEAEEREIDHAYLFRTSVNGYKIHISEK